MFASCHSEMDKPQNLISEENMINIFYDLAIMDAMRSHNPLSLETRGLKPDSYVYAKYKIDSLQFANSNKYYAADIEKYKTMYSEVAKRLKTKIAKEEMAIKEDPNSNELEVAIPVENSTSPGVIR